MNSDPDVLSFMSTEVHMACVVGSKLVYGSVTSGITVELGTLVLCKTVVLGVYLKLQLLYDGS